MGKITELDQKLVASTHRLFATQNTGTLADSQQLLTSLILFALGLGHLCFFAFFSYFEVKGMATFNLFSVLFYLLIIIADRRQWLSVDASLSLVVIEVCTHAILATHMIGWDSGFAIYPVVISALIISFSGRSLLLSLATIALFLASMTMSDVMFYEQIPLYILNSETLNLSRRINYTVGLLSLSIAALYYHFLLSSVDRSLQNLAEEDQLTGLYNRRALEKYAHDAILTSHSLRAPVCIAIGDIDHFKQINDNYGHSAGDSLLIATADTLKLQRRKADIVARWGGEEFAWVLPNTNLSNAYSGMDRIRGELEAMETEVDGRPLKISMTIGVTEVQPGECFKDAIHRADRALYQGKGNGRNQVNAGQQSASPSFRSHSAEA